MVASLTMVFVALSAIADDFGVTLRAVTWVVVAQALAISALLMPVGRLADVIGWKRMHLAGLVLFAAGSLITALAPTFGLLIVARLVMAVGIAMGQAVGTAMLVSVFPPSERGTALGSQTTAVAIGAASGPVIGGIALQAMPWEALFLMLLVPIVIAFVVGFLILDESRMREKREGQRPPFDWGGAILSALAIIVLVLTINDPLGAGWRSPLIAGGLLVVVVLLAAFVYWELRIDDPMLELSLFRNTVFSLTVATRVLGFMGMTATLFLMPIYLISLRGIAEGTAGGVILLMSLGMGLAAQAAGHLSDRFGPRPFAMLGLAMLLLTTLPMAFLTRDTHLSIVMALLFVHGLGAGLWNVPNGSVIFGSAPVDALGVVAAFTNLTRNVGDVVGQAIASGVVVAVMTANGFDVPLGEVGDSVGASDAFIDGWRAAYFLVTGFTAVGLLLTAKANPPTPR